MYNVTATARAASVRSQHAATIRADRTPGAWVSPLAPYAAMAAADAVVLADRRAAELRAAYAARRTPAPPRGVLVRLVRFVVGG